jgi:hypothetical protein
LFETGLTVKAENTIEVKADGVVPARPSAFHSLEDQAGIWGGIKRSR